MCALLTRITATNKVLLGNIPLEVVAPKHVVTRVYTRRPKVYKSVLNSNPKVVKSMTANRMELGTSWGSDTSIAPSSSSFIDCRLSKLFCVFGLWMLQAHDRRSLSAHQFRSRGTNLYSLSIGDMMMSSPICLLSKATKTKSWLWHRRLSHLNFGAINHLARHGLVCGLPRLKFEKDHLCSACPMGKNKKESHKPKSEDTNQEKLYLLHMDLCGPMRVESVNGKNSGPRLQCMTPAISSSGLVPNPPSLAPFVPPSRHEWDLVFQLVFDEFFSPLASV
ncbi:retrovirus-related pol polyprotein from transposon TNT 1-94, partial [Tanacetum coccineum]